MRVIKPSATLMKHNIPPYGFIEKVGRICYKSEDKIEDGSAEKFVANLVKRNHWAMLEHEHIYLVFTPAFMNNFLAEMYANNEPLTYFNITHQGNLNIMSGSFRSFHDLFEQDYSFTGSTFDFLKCKLQQEYPLVFGEMYVKSCFYYDSSIFILDRETFINRYRDVKGVLFKHLIHTFLFVCDRGVSHELVRHRPSSFAQESTRYCNYCLDKHGNEITVIDPCFWNGENSAYPYEVWKEQCESAEKSYIRLLDMGAKPQEARTVLPNSLKTELVITATEKEWQHIVNLRYYGTTGAPHPQAKEVMGYVIKPLLDECEGRLS